MKKHIIRALSLFIFFCGAAGPIQAQTPADRDLAAVVQGIMAAVEFAEKSDSESGKNLPGTLAWKRTGEYGDDIHLAFADFSYCLLSEEESGRVILLSGALDISDSVVNGALKVRGDISLSDMAFYDFDSYGGTDGKITAGGLSLTNDEFADIFAGYRYNDTLLTWEMEAIVACALGFISGESLEWDTGENVLDSFLGQEARPAPGRRVSNPEKTLTAVSRKDGIDFIYNKFPVEMWEIPLKPQITGEVAMRFEGDPDDRFSVFFNGAAKFQGLPSITSMQFKNCRLTESFTDEEAGGSVVIDGREFLVSDFFAVLKIMF
jgi:hypothetical protein